MAERRWLKTIVGAVIYRFIFISLVERFKTIHIVFRGT